MYRDINQEHDSMLKRMLGIPDDGTLPEPVVASYWEHKKLADRIDWQLQPAELIAIVRAVPKELIAEETDREANMRSAVYLYTKKKIAHGHPVQYSWRKKLRTGKIIGVTRDGSGVMVQDDDTGDEREVENSLVEVLELANAN